MPGKRIPKVQLLTLKRWYDTRLIAFAVSVLYLISIQLFIGLTIENYLIAIGYNFFILITSQTRKFILAFTIFIFFGIFYDFLKVFPNYLFNEVDIQGLYSLEKFIFGFTYNGIRITPNEFFAITNNVTLDIVSSFFYINWMPVPLAFAVFLYFTNKRQYLHFALTFLIVNLIGFAGYYLHPAAPPWYVDLYGFTFDTSIERSAAAFTRIDNLMGIDLFRSIYTRNSNVFAAIPSLHCAYPVVVLVYGIKNRMGKVNWFFSVFMLGIWFAAVYSNHHYIIDVTLGILCALVGILIFDKVLLKINRFKSFVSKYLVLIS